MSRLLALCAFCLLSAACLAPAFASAQAPYEKTLYEKTPYVALAVTGNCSGNAIGCFGSGQWVATCPTGAAFSAGRDAEQLAQVRTTDASGRSVVFATRTESVWTQDVLRISSNFAQLTYQTPPPSADDATPLSGYWGRPVGFTCTLADPAVEPYASRSLSQVREHQVTHRTSTHRIMSHGTRRITRLACADGHRLVDSHASVGVYARRQPSRAHSRHIRVRHLRFLAHTRTDVLVRDKLPRSSRVVLQQHAACLPTS